MKILVTGAAGFIGMTASLRLLARGDEVVGLDNMNDYYEVSLKENRLKRLTALPGPRVGPVATAAAFALCHGAPAVLPIHMGLGLYLGWLRERSGSLLPGMLMHFAYNGTIVVLGIG